MKITLLCNAGLLIETESSSLLVDAPNEAIASFGQLPDTTWEKILHRDAPFDKIDALWFSHIHPDHCDMRKVKQYQNCWPNVFCFIPQIGMVKGKGRIGNFQIEYCRIDHAPLPDPPMHVATYIKTEGKSVYIAADSILDPEKHEAFLNGRRVDAAFWNAMYLSRPETRALLNNVSKNNYVYHMPANKDDPDGIWKKLNKNLMRYGEELKSVRVLSEYPSQIII